MRTKKRIALALPLALALTQAGPLAASAAEPAASDLQKELKALKARVDELEKAQQQGPPRPGEGAPGMTPEQQQELNRIAVKAEGLEDAREASGLKGFKLSGWMDPMYSYNANLKQGQFQFLNPIAAVGYGYASSYTGTVSLDFQKETENGTRLRITLMPARSSSDVVEALGGIVHEASFSLPLGSLQTRLIGGQVPDWSGYEYMAPTQTKLITHNLLFDFTEPTFYTGVGLDLVRGKWELKAMIANQSASHRSEREWVPVLTYRGDYSGGEFWGVGFAGVNGKARNFQPGATHETWLDLLEVDGYFTRGNVSLQGQLGAGHQKQAAITPDPETGKLRDAMWIGASAQASYKATPRLEGVLRADYLMDHWNGGGLLAYAVPDDRNGIGPAGHSVAELPDGRTNSDPHGDPSKGADRYAVTVGVNYAVSQNATFKLEYRFDGATQPVFRASAPKDDLAEQSFARTNHLASTSLVLYF